MFKYSLLSFLRAAAFSHCLSADLVLNRRTLAATALYETYNIHIVKKYNRFIVFWEHKLCGFPQSDMCETTFLVRVRYLIPVYEF